MLKKKPFFSKILLFSLLLSLTSSSCYSANIIFDLGGVLLGYNKLSSVKKVGFYSFAMYLLRFNNPFALRTRLFGVLDSIPSICQNEYGAADDNGKLLPGVLCDWMTGNRTSQEIRGLIGNFIQNNSTEFYNAAEQTVIQKITESMFAPQNFADSMYLLKDGVKFLKECKKQGHKLFVLSNWDRESFPYLLQKYPEIFSLFDDVIISGEIGLIKPDPMIYEYILIKNGLNRKECIFFDDQEVNIESAKNNNGIHSILCKKLNYKDMTQALNRFIANLEHQKEILEYEENTQKYEYEQDDHEYETMTLADA